MILYITTLGCVNNMAKILVVDDEAKILKMVSDYLEAVGFEVTGAPDGITALKKFREAEFDLIVLDFMLPGIDGIEACPEYITPHHKLIYNNIYIGDALNIIHTIKQNYDLILLIDIFEHFSYEYFPQFIHYFIFG